MRAFRASAILSKSIVAMEFRRRGSLDDLHSVVSVVERFTLTLYINSCFLLRVADIARPQLPWSPDV
jgi:hypothetical protein